MSSDAHTGHRQRCPCSATCAFVRQGAVLTSVCELVTEGETLCSIWCNSDVIMLDYQVKVRPIPGMFVQSVPATVIPWGRIKPEQRDLLMRSIRQDE